MFARNYCLWGIRRQIHPTNNARTCLHMTDIKMDPTRTSHLQTNIDMNGWTINLVKINTYYTKHASKNAGYDITTGKQERHEASTGCSPPARTFFLSLLLLTNKRECSTLIASVEFSANAFDAIAAECIYVQRQRNDMMSLNKMD